MRKPALVAAVVVLVASLGTLAALIATRDEVVRAVDIPGVDAAMLDRAAQAAHGQRVLAIVARPGAAATGRIVQSAKAAEGWRPYPATADAGDPLNVSLDALAAAAASEYARSGRFEPPTIRALQILGVATIVFGDGAARWDPGERDPDVGTAPEVPALRLRHVSPVVQVLAEGAEQRPDDPVGFVRALRKGDAQFQDDEYRAWGGGVTVDAAADGEFLFPWSPYGARVTVDGGPATTRAAAVPLLVVRLPAGRRRVEVDHGEPAGARDAVAIAAAAGVVASLVAFWLALRPRVPPAATA
jgi:hypothetical protein